MTQVVEGEALSSNPITESKRRGDEKRRQREWTFKVFFVIMWQH
jgi:hypothetical protein